MYNFDGDYRRRPMQSLGGISNVNDRETVIKKAQLERQKRNELRRQNNGATILQSYSRSFLIRQQIKRNERVNYDQFWATNKGNLTSNNDDQLSYLLKRLLFFYTNSNSSDWDRLVNICKIIIKNPNKILQNCTTNPIWLHRIKKLLIICLEQLSVPNKNVQAIPMRTLEIFTSEESVKRIIHDGNDDNVDDENVEKKCIKYFKELFEYLIRKDYFKKLRSILEDKCPPLDGDILQAPNQLTDALYQMIMRPLMLINRQYHNEFYITSTQICNSFVKNFLSKEYTESIMNFIIPCLTINSQFPFHVMINSLCTEYIDDLNKMKIDGEDETTTNKNNEFQDLFTSFLLYAILNLDTNQADKFSDKSILSGYIRIISLVLPKINDIPKSSRQYRSKNNRSNNNDDDDDDSSDSDSGNKEILCGMTIMEKECLLRSIELLNEPKRVYAITNNIDLILDDPETLHSLCKICHDLMIFNKWAIYDYKLLYTLAFMPKFLRSVWFTLASESSQLGFSSPLSLLSKGVVPKADIDINRTIPFLATFCALFGRLVPTLHDGEFCKGNNTLSFESNDKTITIAATGMTTKSLMPFTLNEIVQLSKTLKEISLGLVELAFPETRSNINEHYRSVLGHNSDNMNDEKIKKTKQIWSNLLKVVVSILNQIHTRDLRRNFCPDGHWIIQTLNLPLDRPTDLPLTRGGRRGGLRPFQPIRDFTREDFENGSGPPMSTKQIRSITILREIPFIVPFNTRVNILQGLIAADKIRVQGDLQGFLQGPSIQITVRRSHLYEDAYDKLRPENEPDLRHKFRVQFINNLNLEEAGIDGGGLFREFLSELIKTAFDPNRGFFMVTTDNKLYPNPSVGDLIEDYERHYYFMGRILGKAIYEHLLVELPLAEFFLSKLAGKYSDVDVHQLASLDPVLYRNLLSLKEYEGEVSDLGLDFTVVSNDLGTTKIKELKPNGQYTPVTSSNRIEYIQLMADFKLNKQIRQHCIAFRRGLSNVLPVEWLYMFSNKELQILISGAEIPINLDDLKMHCRYGGEYSPTHPTIKCFWKVVDEFTDLQKRQLLKFVTSCSRPPLLGFKDLDPPFSIQNAVDEERLPTASTCTNLLKLPAFKTVEQMKEKLLYAIQAGAGFDLS